ncbi:hypothetical protein Tco_1291659 [Tanacetum coccineum]
MTTLKFADTHNLVVFLEKSTKTDGLFKQIQFWTTAKVKTVNGVVQLQALVDGKKIIITESIVRRDLQLEDAEGVDYEAVYKELDDSLVRAATTASILEAEQDSGNIIKTQYKATPNEKRVKKLEKKRGSRTHKLTRLYRVGRSARVVSSEEANLSDQEDASKQGRKIHDIDADEDITLENVHDAEMFNVNDLDGDEVVVESEVTDKAELKSARPKTKGVVMQEPNESTPTISLQLPSQVKGQGSKDKGKAKMIEPEKPLKKKDHIKFDEEEALRLQAKFDEEDRLAREKAQQVEEANIAWDDIQAKIDADYQLAERLQAQEQQELTIEEKSTLFVQLLEKRKKHFAAKRAEEKRNRPPTRAQQRSIITELVEESFKKDKAKIAQESSSKRAGDEIEQENAKKQKSNALNVLAVEDFGRVVQIGKLNMDKQDSGGFRFDSMGRFKDNV